MLTSQSEGRMIPLSDPFKGTQFSFLDRKSPRKKITPKTARNFWAISVLLCLWGASRCLTRTFGVQKNPKLQEAFSSIIIGLPPPHFFSFFNQVHKISARPRPVKEGERILLFNRKNASRCLTRYFSDVTAPTDLNWF